jgi:hypothetical protein
MAALLNASSFMMMTSAVGIAAAFTGHTSLLLLHDILVSVGVNFLTIMHNVYSSLLGSSRMQ